MRKLNDYFRSKTNRSRPLMEQLILIIMKFFSKKMLFLTLLCSISISLMSFKNNSNSSFGTANVVSTSSNFEVKTEKVAFTGLVRAVGRYAARYTAAAVRNLTRYTDEMAMNTACFVMKDNNENNRNLAMLNEYKKAKIASLN